VATWPHIWPGILHYLILLGLPAVTATSTGEAAHPTRSADKGDVVIALGFRRSLRQTVEGLQQSRPNGAYCVGIADTTVSSSARFSHECLIASVETPSYGASYAAPICSLNGLICASGYFNRKKTLELLQKAADEQRQGFRWYRD
jgi:RpiR family transcriptional regulator, carbohydrate utilization regulator